MQTVQDIELQKYIILALIELFCSKTTQNNSIKAVIKEWLEKN